MNASGTYHEENINANLDPINQFTIAVVRDGNRGKLLRTWDRTQYSAPIAAN
ncbi:MAG: hypothetical protein ABI613_04055 [Gemmatimonadota bacterium]